MNCIKCGVEVPENQTFCQSCLAEMEKYPVRPDITVTLPHRTEASINKKKNRRQRPLSPEEQLRRTRYNLRLTRLALVAVFICFLLVSAMFFQYLQR